MPGQPNQDFGDLSFDRMWSTNAEKDKETSLAFGVYRGRASLNVFSGRGGPPKLKLPLPRQHNVLFRRLFDVVRKSGPDTSITVPAQEWDPQTKKMNTLATVTVGFDATNAPYIGLAAAGRLDATKFPIRTDLKWDLSGAKDLNQSAIALESFLSAMDNMIQAMNLTNFKFDPSQRPGGQSGAGGQQRSAYNAPRQPAADVLDDTIPF